MKAQPDSNAHQTRAAWRGGLGFAAAESENSCTLVRPNCHAIQHTGQNRPYWSLVSVPDEDLTGKLRSNILHLLLNQADIFLWHLQCISVLFSSCSCASFSNVSFFLHSVDTERSLSVTIIYVPDKAMLLALWVGASIFVTRQHLLGQSMYFPYGIIRTFFCQLQEILNFTLVYWYTVGSFKATKVKKLHDCSPFRKHESKYVRLFGEENGRSFWFILI